MGRKAPGVRSAAAIGLLAAVLALAVGNALAQGRVAKPAVAIEPGTGPCIAPPAEMRRNHMEMLKHQRDRTLRDGVRGAKVTLNGCIDCHASKTSGSAAASRQDFCEGCHAYAAVKLDCFECHQPAKAGAAARPAAAAGPAIAPATGAAQ